MNFLFGPSPKNKSWPRACRSAILILNTSSSHRKCSERVSDLSESIRWKCYSVEKLDNVLLVCPIYTVIRFYRELRIKYTKGNVKFNLFVLLCTFIRDSRDFSAIFRDKYDRKTWWSSAIVIIAPTYRSIIFFFLNN